MENEHTGIEELLSADEFEDGASKTFSRRLWEATQIIFIAIAFTALVALAAIGALSVWFSYYLS